MYSKQQINQVALLTRKGLTAKAISKKVKMKIPSVNFYRGQAKKKSRNGVKTRTKPQKRVTQKRSVSTSKTTMKSRVLRRNAVGLAEALLAAIAR